MDPIAVKIAAVTQRIAQAAQTYGRKPASLLAVSKGHPDSVIRRAFAAGQVDFAESYVQEALAKITALADLPITWHFIGPIQSNKTVQIAQHFAWVHSIDRVKIAERLATARSPGMAPLNVCAQVNTSGEASKSGVTPHQLPALIEAINKLPNIRLCGLMAIPAPQQDFAAQRAAFHKVLELFQALRAKGYDLDTLSMGMSDDLEAAIAEGATIVRVGTAIFGVRE